MRVRVVHPDGAWAYTRPVDPDPVTGNARSWLPAWHEQGAELHLRVPKTEPGPDGVTAVPVYEKGEDGVQRPVFVEPDGLAKRLFEPAEEDVAAKAAKAKQEAEVAKAKADRLAAEAKAAEDAAKAKAAAEAEKAVAAADAKEAEAKAAEKPAAKAKATS